MTDGVYVVAGLRIDSPIRLAAPVVEGPGDWTLFVGEECRPSAAGPTDQVLAEMATPARVLYRVTRRMGEDGIALDLPGLADFEVDPTRRTVVARLHPGADPALLPILVTGTLAALLLSLGGEVVLHASAVEVDGVAVAFAGRSGQGKTTMAALCCAAGYPLVADDLLPVAVGDDGVVSCVPAARELRLRPRVEALADLLAGHGSRRYLTADSRHAVAPAATVQGRLPLDVIAVPLPDRESREVTASRLAAADAAVTLLRFQRIEEWREPKVVRVQLDNVARIVASVPVSVVRVPWGPPWEADLGSRLISALRRSK